MALRLRRGTDTQRQTITPVDGEIIYTTDTKRLYVGDGSTIGGNGVSAPVASVNNKVGAVTLTTDDIPEGSGNVYLTTERVQDAAAKLFTSVDGSPSVTHTGITFAYDDTANKLTATVPAYTDENAQDAINTLLTNGTQTGISYAYNDSSNSLSSTITAGILKNAITSNNIYLIKSSGGSQYVRAPSATLVRRNGDTTGTGGTLVTFLTPNAIQSIEIVNGGTGYTTAPTITITADSFDNLPATATAICTVSGGVIDSVTVDFQGHYQRNPIVTVTPTNGGSGAVLRALMFPTSVSRIEVVNPGTGWTQTPTVQIVNDAGDTTGNGASWTSGISPELMATTPDDTLDFTAGSDRIQIITSFNGGKRKLVFDTRPTGEIAAEIKGAIPYYGATGNNIVGARGLNYLDSVGTLQIGSETQAVDGTLRVIYNQFSTAPGTALTSFEQYHENSNCVAAIFLRARGTQTSPLAVQSNDKIGQLLFGARDGTSNVFGTQIASRVDGTFTPGSGKMPQRFDFFTSNGVESTASLAFKLSGNKTATFYGAAQLVVYANSTARDAAITSPTPGMMIFVTGTGVQVRGASAWNTITGTA